MGWININVNPPTLTCSNIKNENNKNTKNLPLRKETVGNILGNNEMLKIW